MTKKEITREYIIQTIIELDFKSKKTIGRKALREKGINGYQIQKHIPEGLTKLKKNRGLKISRQEQPHDPNDLLKMIDNIVSKLKKMPTWVVLRRDTGITDKVFISHFGKRGIKEVFSHYREWLKTNKPSSKNIKFVDDYLKGKSKIKTSPRQVQRRVDGKIFEWIKDPDKTQYGRPLNFGNLLLEPTNEQGVVFLFGMVSKRLGFTVKHVRPEFPDCEAMEHLKGGRTQEVKIEFKYRSRGYNYSTEGCDIIVCWEDNWGDECPLRVIEIKKEINKLRKLKLPEFDPIK